MSKMRKAGAEGEGLYRNFIGGKRDAAQDGNDQPLPAPDKFVMYTHPFLKRVANLREPERRVYDAISARFGPGKMGLVWPNQSTIAHDAGYKRRLTVGRALRELRAHSLIDIIDWPITIFEEDGSFREVGGGKANGKYDVFMLLHVDEGGYHCEQPQRPCVADLRATMDETSELFTVLLDFALSGARWEQICKWMLARYPFLKENERWQPSEKLGDGDTFHFSIDYLSFDSALIPFAALEHRFPRAGCIKGGGPWLQHPDSFDRQIEHIKNSWERYEAAAAAVAPVYQSILSEANRAASLSRKERERGGSTEFNRVAPTLAKLSRELNILPIYLINMADTHAISEGNVMLRMKDGKVVEIDCKWPDDLVPEDVRDLAMMPADKLSRTELSNFEATLRAIRKAQRLMLIKFIEMTFPPGEDDATVLDLVCAKWNQWAEMRVTKLLSPIQPVSPDQIRKIQREILEASENGIRKTKSA